METQPQNPEFRNNPENFHPCVQATKQENLSFCLFDSLRPINNLSVM